jgi:orotate phosphoribosyltransferase
MLFARLVAEIMPCARVLSAVRDDRGEFILSNPTAAATNGKRVLLVDDGANSGETLLSLAGLVIAAGGRLAGALVVLNRLRPTVNVAMQAFLKPFGFVCRLDEPVYTEADCPDPGCRRDRRAAR